MVRIGIIGAGPNAAGHARYFAQSPRSQVIAVADLDQERAQALAAETDAEPVADFHDFLDRVDAVVVSSPNFLHHDHAIACAQAGKHVYCEKPMGLTLAEAKNIAAAVTEAGVKSAVGYTVRFEPVIQTALLERQEEKLGSMISLISRRLDYFDPKNTVGWRKDYRLSGGILQEICVHELDWMLAIGGEVQSVHARAWSAQGNPDARSNDHIWITLNFASGATGFHEGSWSSATPVYYRGVVGSARGLHTDEWSSLLYGATLGEKRAQLELAPKFDLRAHFLDCIEHDATPVADVLWGVKVAAVAEAAIESANTGQVVAISALDV